MIFRHPVSSIPDAGHEQGKLKQELMLSAHAAPARPGQELRMTGTVERVGESPGMAYDTTGPLQPRPIMEPHGIA